VSCEVGDTHTVTRGFAGVGWTDAALGGADLAACGGWGGVEGGGGGGGKGRGGPRGA